MDTKLALKLCEKAIDKTPPALTGVVAELAGTLAGHEIDLSKEGRARYLARKY